MNESFAMSSFGRFESNFKIPFLNFKDRKVIFFHEVDEGTYFFYFHAKIKVDSDLFPDASEKFDIVIQLSSEAFL